MYHGVAARNRAGATRLVPAVETRVVAAHLGHLRKHYAVVPPSRLLEAACERRRGDRFPVAVTFDDDLRSHVAEALPLLQEVGVPAAFFLCGASLSGPFRFWWENLEAAAEILGDRLPEVALGRPIEGRLPTLRELACELEAMVPAERDAAAARLQDTVGADPDEAGLRADQVRALAAAGFEIGFHTLRHDVLPPLDDKRLEGALVDGRQAVAAAAELEPTMLAYPHGKADSRVAVAARAAGYAFGFTGGRRPVTDESDPLLLGRLDAGSRTPLQFVLMVAWTLLH